MHVEQEPRDVTQTVRLWRAAGLRVALVPTMGALHEGHLSLLDIAREHADRVVVSIFVNPTQFGPGEDLDAYPRTRDADLAACETRGADLVFCPEVTAMYASSSSVVVTEDVLSRGLCGRVRPGHFQGVLTVVAKLFNIVAPDVAVFGQKDAQQARLIQQLVRDLSYPIDIVVAPIVREADGLAMSSRNRYLTGAERGRARCLHEGLDAVAHAVAAGERQVAVLEQLFRSHLDLADGDRVDYVAFVASDTLAPVARLSGTVLVAVRVCIGQTGLLDNVVLDIGPPTQDTAGSR